METDPAPLEVGDTVTIGDARLDWQIVAIHTDPNLAGANGPLAYIKSGQTGRHRYELVSNLTRWTPRSPA